MGALFVLCLRALIFTITIRFCTANLGCSQELGTGINPQHCEEAMKHFFAASAYHVAGGSIHDYQWFSRNLDLVDTFRHLPKAFVYKTCSIGIDLSDRPHPPTDDTGKRASWAVFARELQTLIRKCPGTHRWGGIAMYRDFEFIIVNPAAGIAEGTCLTPHRPLGISLSLCIERQLEVRRRTQGHSRPLPVLRAGQQPPSQAGVQQPPLSDPEVHGGAGPSNAQPPAPPMTSAQQLAGLHQRFEAARQRQRGQWAADDHLRQQAQRINQQMPNAVQLQAQDRAQQEDDRRAQRKAASEPQPRIGMAHQQQSQQQQPPRSVASTVAPLQLGQQPQGSSSAWLMNRLLQAHHTAQQPQPTAQAAGPASPPPGSPSTITENSTSGLRRGAPRHRSPGEVDDYPGSGPSV